MTTIYAILDETRTRIEQIHEIGSRLERPLIRQYGTRCVYLPMGGSIGDRVTVDDDSKATVIEDEEATR